MRQDFVANVSHEFKTPLTAIQGFAETLLNGALDDKSNRQRFVEIIRDHARRLARLTDDLLKLSRIEAGRLELEIRPVRVEELVNSCVETARMKAEMKGQRVHVQLPEGLPPVRGDGAQLGEVLQNLLDNAIQYTPNGGQIDITASSNGSEITFTVSDTGIGIPESDLERIFERFYRVDAARSREAGGTGSDLLSRGILSTHIMAELEWKALSGMVHGFTSAWRFRVNWHDSRHGLWSIRFAENSPRFHPPFT